MSRRVYCKQGGSLELGRGTEETGVRAAAELGTQAALCVSDLLSLESLKYDFCFICCLCICCEQTGLPILKEDTHTHLPLHTPTHSEGMLASPTAVQGAARGQGGNTRGS